MCVIIRTVCLCISVEWMFRCVCVLCSIAPALLRQASYGTLKIGLYHYLKKLNPRGIYNMHTVHAGNMCGCVCSI